MLILILKWVVSIFDAAFLVWAIREYTGCRFRVEKVAVLILTVSVLNLILNVGTQYVPPSVAFLMACGGIVAIVALYRALLDGVGTHEVLYPFAMILLTNGIVGYVLGCMTPEESYRLPGHFAGLDSFMRSQLLLYIFNVPVIWRLGIIRKRRMKGVEDHVLWFPAVLLLPALVILLTMLDPQFWSRTGWHGGFSPGGLIVLEYLMLVGMDASLVQKNVLSSRVRAEKEILQACNHHLSLVVDELRGMKHNQENLLSSVMGYLYCEDYDGLKGFVGNALENIRSIDEGYTAVLLNLKEPGLMGIVLDKVRRMKAAGITYELRCPEPIPETFMGPVRLCEIVGILLDNAVEAAAQAGELKRVEADIRAEGSRLVITVSNTVSEHPDILNIFRKGWSSRGSSRGLGLWRLKRVVHGDAEGTIECHSESGWFEIAVGIAAVNSSPLKGVLSHI